MTSRQLAKLNVEVTRGLACLEEVYGMRDQKVGLFALLVILHCLIITSPFTSLSPILHFPTP